MNLFYIFLSLILLFIEIKKILKLQSFFDREALLLNS